MPSLSMDIFKSAPPTLQVQLDSVPTGADARTSLGPGCKTPCSVTIQAPEAGGFSVSYALPKYLPATIPVQVIRNPGDLTTPATTTLDPNPVVAQLQPAGPPPKPPRKMRPKPKKPKAPNGAAEPAGSPFPTPGQAAPPPPPAAAPSR
jgi:hypothetical protein